MEVCLVTELPIPLTNLIKAYQASQVAQNKPDDAEPLSRQHSEHVQGKPNIAMFSTQGALLLQSLLRLHDPFNGSILVR